MPDSTILTDYLLAKTTWLVRGMPVYPERMLRELSAMLRRAISGKKLRSGRR